jgi:hypothetical protein
MRACVLANSLQGVTGPTAIECGCDDGIIRIEENANKDGGISARGSTTRPMPLAAQPRR